MFNSKFTGYASKLRRAKRAAMGRVGKNGQAGQAMGLVALAMVFLLIVPVAVTALALSQGPASTQQEAHSSAYQAATAGLTDYIDNLNSVNLWTTYAWNNVPGEYAGNVNPFTGWVPVTGTNNTECFWYEYNYPKAGMLTVTGKAGPSCSGNVGATVGSNHYQYRTIETTLTEIPPYNYAYGNDFSVPNPYQYSGGCTGNSYNITAPGNVDGANTSTLGGTNSTIGENSGYNVNVGTEYYQCGDAVTTAGPGSCAYHVYDWNPNFSVWNGGLGDSNTSYQGYGPTYGQASDACGFVGIDFHDAAWNSDLLINAPGNTAVKSEDTLYVCGDPTINGNIVTGIPYTAGTLPHGAAPGGDWNPTASVNTSYSDAWSGLWGFGATTICPGAQGIIGANTISNNPSLKATPYSCGPPNGDYWTGQNFDPCDLNLTLQWGAANRGGCVYSGQGATFNFTAGGITFSTANGSPAVAAYGGSTCSNSNGGVVNPIDGVIYVDGQNAFVSGTVNSKYTVVAANHPGSGPSWNNIYITGSLYYSGAGCPGAGSTANPGAACASMLGLMAQNSVQIEYPTTQNYYCLQEYAGISYSPNSGACSGYEQLFNCDDWWCYTDAGETLALIAPVTNDLDGDGDCYNVGDGEGCVGPFNETINAASAPVNLTIDATIDAVSGDFSLGNYGYYANGSHSCSFTPTIDYTLYGTGSGYPHVDSTDVYEGWGLHVSDDNVFLNNNTYCSDSDGDEGNLGTLTINGSLTQYYTGYLTHYECFDINFIIGSIGYACGSAYGGMANASTGGYQYITLNYDTRLNSNSPPSMSGWIWSDINELNQSLCYNGSATPSTATCQ